MSIINMEPKLMHEPLTEAQKEEARAMLFPQMVTRIMQRTEGKGVHPEDAVTAVRVALGSKKDLKSYNTYKKVMKKIHE